LAPPPSPPRAHAPGRHDEREMGTSIWPPAGTYTWPSARTFPWPWTESHALDDLAPAGSVRGGLVRNSPHGLEPPPHRDQLALARRRRRDTATRDEITSSARADVFVDAVRASPGIRTCDVAPPARRPPTGRFPTPMGCFGRALSSAWTHRFDTPTSQAARNARHYPALAPTARLPPLCHGLDQLGRDLPMLRSQHDRDPLTPPMTAVEPTFVARSRSSKRGRTGPNGRPTGSESWSRR
jgi:hypothetical protein